MKRRDFLNKTSISALNLGFLPFAHLQNKSSDPLKVIDLHNYLRSLIEVDEPSVDKIIIGDPDTIITKIGTAWMPYWDTLKVAKAQNVNTLVVHEPTFYTHRDLDETSGSYLSAPNSTKEIYLTQVSDKKKWIEENGMVIIRCHDVLDKIKEFGIPFAFGRALGFTNNNLIRSKRFYNVYEIETKPAIEIAKLIANKLKLVNQPGVAFYGEKNYVVRSVGIGTGYISDPLNFMDLNPDLYVAIDDTIRTWIQTTFAQDSGRPLVVINHGTSEEFGVRELSEHLEKKFTNYEIIHYPQGCSYRWIYPD